MAGPAIYKTAPNVLQVSVNATWASSTNITNVLHFQFDSTPTSVADCTAIVNVVLGSWQNRLLGLFSTAYTVTGANWLFMTAPTSASGSNPPNSTAPTTGSNAGEPLPQNNALLVHKVSSGAGRKARNGRMYLTGGVEVNIDRVGIINPASVTGIQAALDLFYSDVKVIEGTPEGHMCQPHWFQSDKPPEEVGGVWAADSVSTVSGLRLDPLIATQRRRLR